MTILGFRINNETIEKNKSLAKELGTFPSADLADVMGRFGVMDPGIKALDRNMKINGSVITVQTRPGDNLMIHKALEVADIDDVIVVNTNGNTTSAGFGELLMRTAMAAELGGIIVDGAVRDSLSILDAGFPTFSRSICASGCDKDGPGEINYPITCGGIAINPGDIVVGDADGVTVIPLSVAEEVLIKVKEHGEKEKRRIEEINSGIIFKKDINNILKEKGVI